MIYLPDVNVWVALTSDRHIHHAVASEWLQSVPLDQVAFCRITELGLLRLVSNPKVMAEDVLSVSQAWAVYLEWRQDSRVTLLVEQTGFAAHWNESIKGIQGGSNSWTDAYLSAFASHVGAILVTFDRSFPKLSWCSVKTLGLSAS